MPPNLDSFPRRRQDAPAPEPSFATLEQVAIQKPQFLQGHMTKLGLVLTGLSLIGGLFGIVVPAEELKALAKTASDNWGVIGTLVGLALAAYGKIRRNWRQDNLAQIIEPGIDPYVEEGRASQGSPADISGKSAAADGGPGVARTVAALLLASCLLSSCATQNSPIQQAIADRIRGALVVPESGLVGGIGARALGGAVPTTPFQAFFAAPLQSGANLNQGVQP
ncbi:hypothetical protein [Verrucomicrobium spinosum]|uniref:hypothetical protein n=1 Tax=Verrucomicrobium spinosum TaxID=2736 RepID=UPI0001746692|nr:hypothetical protein [Verrucomicrobium spinosum]